MKKIFIILLVLISYNSFSQADAVTIVLHDSTLWLKNFTINDSIKLNNRVPSITGQAGKILATNGVGYAWTAPYALIDTTSLSNRINAKVTGSGTSSGTNTGDQTTVSGNAGSATVLQTARTINGSSWLADNTGKPTAAIYLNCLTSADGKIEFFTSNTNNAGQGTKQMTIGSAGIITMSAYGAGTATFDASGNITSVSDERLKTNIHPYKSGLKELLLLKPIQYQWNEKSGNETKGTYAGFSAQNVKSAIPYGTGENKDGYLSLQDRPLIATLVNAVKEQQQQIDELKREIIKLQQK